MHAMHPGDRLICIRPPKANQAEPLREIDGCEATEDDLRRMYNRLLGTPGAAPGMDTINASLTDKELDQYIIDLVKEIPELPVPVRRYYCNYLNLDLQNISNPCDFEQFMNAKVVSHRGLSQILHIDDDLEHHIQGDFDKVTTEHSTSLRSVVSGLADDAAEKSWLGGVARAVASVISGGEPEEIDVIFRGRDHRVYRPAFHSSRKYAGRSAPPITAHITFHEAFIAPTENAPRDLDSLAVALRLGYSFYWGSHT